MSPQKKNGKGDWVDASGLIAPKSEIERLVNEIRNGEIQTLAELESFFKNLHRNYYELEWSWTSGLLEQYAGKNLAEVTAADLIKLVSQWKECVISLDKLIYEDAKKEFRLSAMTGFGMDGDNLVKKQDFVKVRGTFEKNRFVTEIIEHIRKKSELGDKIISQLQQM